MSDNDINNDTNNNNTNNNTNNKFIIDKDNIVKFNIEKSVYNKISSYYFNKYQKEIIEKKEGEDMLLSSTLNILQTFNTKRKITYFINNFYRNTFSSKIGIIDKSLLYFSKVQSVYSNLRKFVFICKIKIKKDKIDTDLCLNELSSIKNKYKIILIDDDNKYTFTIHDLINIINTNLCNMEDKFPEPKTIKNPYTNLDFEINNLYNIYFFIKNSNIKIPRLFELYFLSNFNIVEFSNIYDYDIREYGIKNYCNNLSDKLFRRKVGEMLKKYQHIIQINIDKEFPIKELRRVMSKYIYLHIVSVDSLIETKKFYYSKILKKKLSNFNKLNPTYGRKIYSLKKDHNNKPIGKYVVEWETNIKNVNILDTNINSNIYKSLYDDFLGNNNNTNNNNTNNNYSHNIINNNFVDINKINIPTLIGRRRRRPESINQNRTNRVNMSNSVEERGRNMAERIFPEINIRDISNNYDNQINNTIDNAIDNTIDNTMLSNITFTGITLTEPPSILVDNVPNTILRSANYNSITLTEPPSILVDNVHNTTVLHSYLDNTNRIIDTSNAVMNYSQITNEVISNDNNIISDDNESDDSMPPLIRNNIFFNEFDEDNVYENNINEDSEDSDYSDDEIENETYIVDNATIENEIENDYIFNEDNLDDDDEDDLDENPF